MITVCSHQPSFYPWAGFWLKVKECDEIIFSTGVDYNRRGYQNRVKLLGHWWTVPVLANTRKRVCDVEFDRGKLGAALTHARNCLTGRKVPYRLDVIDLLDRAVAHADQTKFLGEFNILCFIDVARFLGLDIKVVIDTDIPSGETKEERLLNRVNKYFPEPCHYLAGSGSKAYLSSLGAHKLSFQEGVAAPDCSILELIASNGSAALNNLFSPLEK